MPAAVLLGRLDEDISFALHRGTVARAVSASGARSGLEERGDKRGSAGRSGAAHASKAASVRAYWRPAR